MMSQQQTVYSALSELHTGFVWHKMPEGSQGELNGLLLKTMEQKDSLSKITTSTSFFLRIPFITMNYREMNVRMIRDNQCFLRLVISFNNLI